MICQMARPRQPDPYALAVNAGAIVSAVGLGAIGLAVGRWGSVIGLAAGTLPWLGLALLRPRVMLMPALGRGLSATVITACLLGVAALTWLAAAVVIDLAPSREFFLIAALAASLTASVAVAAGSQSRTWLPAALMGTAILAAVAVLAGFGAWTAACAGCEIGHYHEAPTRSFMFVTWAFVGYMMMSGFAMVTVLFTYAARSFAWRSN